MNVVKLHLQGVTTQLAATLAPVHPGTLVTAELALVSLNMKTRKNTCTHTKDILFLHKKYSLRICM